MSAPERVFYDEAQANRWLGWLAHQMQRNAQTVFLIETLQPSWLETRGDVRTFSVLTRLVWGAWSGLVFALSIGLLIGPAEGLHPYLLINALTVGLICGLVAGLVDGRKLGGNVAAGEVVSSPTSRSYVVSVLRVGLLVGIIIVVFNFTTVYLLEPAPSDRLGNLLFDVLFISPIAAPFLGLIFGLIYTSRSTVRSASTEIRTLETVTWLPAAALRAGGQAMVLGGLIGLCIGLLAVALSGGSDFMLLVSSFTLIAGLVSGLFFGLIGGITPVVRDLKTRPNQGMRLSVLNSMRIGATGGLMYGIFIWLAGAPLEGFTGSSPSMGIASGLLAAIALGGWFGGIDVAEHVILRFILARKHYSPRNYARFLDYAAGELHFLQKVGGGYIFVHRYLLEYFAAQYAASAPPAEGVKPELLPQ